MDHLLATGLFPVNSKQQLEASSELIEGNDILNTKFRSNIKFYRYKNVVFDELLLGGHFQAKGTNIENDIIISSFPKTGTTWLQEISYLVVNDEEESDRAAGLAVDRGPFLELLGHLSVEDFKKMPSPKLLKTHLPYSVLMEDYSDRKYKIIYICRNPKDTVTSLYFFYKMSKIYQFNGTMSEMVDLFVNDLAIYSPFAKHVLEFWEKSKTDDGILFLQYEELQLNLRNNVKKIAQFLEKDLSENRVESITELCTFSSMSAKNTCNEVLSDSSISQFFRKGKVGDWKNHLSEEDNRKMDKWIKNNFANSDFKFIYE